MTTTNRISAGVGDKLTVLATVTVPNPTGGIVGVNLTRGTVLEVTESFVDDTRDRTGSTWLSDLSDAAQTARWGEVRFVVGDASDRVFWWQADETSKKLARDRARYNADRIADPAERAAAVQLVRDTYGPDTSASMQYGTLAHGRNMGGDER